MEGVVKSVTEIALNEVAYLEVQIFSNSYCMGTGNVPNFKAEGVK